MILNEEAAELLEQGRKSFNDNDYEKAKSLFELSIRSQKNPKAYSMLGLIYLEELEQPDEALSCAKRSIAVEESANAYNLMGDCFGELGEFDKAEESYLRAIDLDSEYGDSYVGVASVKLFHRRESESAKAYLQQSLKCSTLHSLVDAHLMLGIIGRLEGDWDSYRTNVYKAHKTDKAFLPAYIEYQQMCSMFN